MSAQHRAVDIINERGLHARASHKFVLKVQEYDATIRVEKDGMTVGGTSIMGLMMLPLAKVQPSIFIQRVFKQKKHLKRS